MLQNRPPIIVILGHVDHGKTSLLDFLAQTNVVSTEAGGITQGTRAFQAHGYTFIDTPGHEAFSAMRARGGKLADIAVLVVAGNDGVKPQTKESIGYIKDLQIPFVVAATKADLPEFNLDKVRSQLAENGVLVEGFGGQVPLIPVSVKNQKSLDDLLETINLLSQLYPSLSDTEAVLEAVVLESRLDSKKGPLATLIVKSGTLTTGQQLYLGEEPVGKARTLTIGGGRINTALPAQPVEIMGLMEVMEAGSVLTSRPGHSRSALLPKHGGETGGEEGIKIILKTDALGSLEAIGASLPPGVSIVAASSGDVSESDVILAQSTKAKIVGFNVQTSGSVAKLAEIDKVQIYTFKVIYDLLDKLEELVHPRPVEVETGRAEILAEFDIEGQRVAGCKCVEGVFKRGGQVKIGDNKSRIKSLRIAKTEMGEVRAGQEFGAIFSPAIDFRVGDSIIAVEPYGSA